MSKSVPTPQKLQASNTLQGTLVSSNTKVANVSAQAEIVTITPDDLTVGTTIELSGTEYPITTVTRSPFKPNSGTALAQKPATIQLPENTTQPVKKFSFLIVKSF